jgi:integrase/recombinase XerC
MPLAELYSANEFLNYLTFQKRYSKHTIIAYKNDLNNFFEFISEEYGAVGLKEVSSPMVRSWLASLKENKSVAKTINRKISSLKSFFKYELKMNHIDLSPMTTTSALKVSRRLPSFINEKEIHQLFTENDFPATFEGKMHFLILTIFYQTGMRRSELINLKEQHIDKSDSNIKILGKGNKERRIPVSNQLLQLIDEFILEKRKEYPDFSTTYLFVNKKGAQLDPKYIYNMVKRNLAKVSTNEGKSPHVLRHSFATHLTNNGAPLNDVKELLGHSSLASTQIYTHNSIEKLKEIYNQAHPKS